MKSLEIARGDTTDAAPLGKAPWTWLKEQNLGHGYWIFFFAAFFYDAGFSVYFFLFNLYLMDRGLNDQAIGWIGGSLTLGSLVGTLPAGLLTRRTGLRSLLVALFLVAPMLNAMRALWVWEPAQIGLAFFAGVTMSAWGVCFLPAVARFTNKKNRTSAFSLIFSASVGTSMMGGIVCGYLRRWLEMVGIALHAALVKELILLMACALVLPGLYALLRLPIADEIVEKKAIVTRETLRGLLKIWKLSPFLRRYLPLMALWSAVLAAFTPFANVYLARDLHIPMERVGLIFSVVQCIQLCMGVMVPLVTRLLGLVGGIAATQTVAAIVLGGLAMASNGNAAVVLYLVFSAAQWMSSPGLYNLLMNETPDRERSQAAAMTLFCNALAGSIATAGAGVLLTRFGYPRILMGLALVAVAIALSFATLLSLQAHKENT